MVALIVSVTVGQDCPRGEIRARTTLSNLNAMPRLADLFIRFGIAPTYFINYAVASRSEGAWFGEQSQQNRCEIGAFFEPRLRDRFGVNESEHVLLDSLNAVGFSHESIDIVVLSHLHFDIVHLTWKVNFHCL